MYKREISILCSFFFPTLFLWGWASKRLYADGEAVSQGYFLSGENVDAKVPRYSRLAHNPLSQTSQGYQGYSLCPQRVREHKAQGKK